MKTMIKKNIKINSNNKKHLYSVLNCFSEFLVNIVKFLSRIEVENFHWKYDTFFKSHKLFMGNFPVSLDLMS